MADLIDREAAKEAVKYIPWCDWKAVGDCLDELPAVDAVEVVRCGSPCRWLYDGADDYCCTNHKGLVKITPESFCSYGERREENA